MTTTDRVVFIGGGVVMLTALLLIGAYVGSVSMLLAGVVVGLCLIALVIIDDYLEYREHRRIRARQDARMDQAWRELQRRAAMRRAETAIHASVAHLRVVSSERPCHGCAAWIAPADLVDGYCATCRDSAQPQDAA